MRGDERMEFGERDAWDERIDAALRRYMEAPQYSDPRIALARIRARAEQERPRRRSVWAWAVSCSLVAGLIALMAVWMLRAPREPQIAWTPRAPGVATVEHAPMGELRHGQPVNAGPSTRDSNPCCDVKSGAAIRTIAQDDTVSFTAAERSLPKQEVFPTPQPLSAQEQRLAAFLHQAPPVVKEQVLAAQQSDESIELAAIQIKPLDESSAEPQTKGKELP